VPVALALTFAVALALAAALAAAPADARSRGGTVRITTDSRHDTTQVKEITIDDEGIRIVGGTKGEVRMPIPPEPNEPGQIEINKHGVRIIGMGEDSLGVVRIHSDGDNDVVQFFKDAHIEKGEQAGPVVAIFGNVRNDGIITGDCVAVMGSIIQGDSALIMGDAVTVGGAVREAGTGARVNGETISIGFLPFAGFAVPSVAILLMFGLISFILFVFLAALAARLFPERMVRMAETISQRTLMSLVVGLLSIPVALMLCVLLFVTLIGIPLAVLLPFLFVLAAFFGYAAAAYLLGSKILGRRPSAAAGMFVPILTGTGFVTLFYAIGVPLLAIEGTGRVFGVGFLILWLVVGTVCWMMGLGALLLSRIGQEPRSRTGGQWATSGAAPTSASAPATASAGPSTPYSEP